MNEDRQEDILVGNLFLESRHNRFWIVSTVELDHASNLTYVDYLDPETFQTHCVTIHVFNNWIVSGVLEKV